MSDLETIDTFADTALASIAFLLVFLALSSQWFFGFYAADYYDGAALQQHLDASNQQFLAIDFKCPQTVKTQQ